MQNCRIDPDLKPESITVVVGSGELPAGLRDILARGPCRAIPCNRRSSARWSYVSRGTIAGPDGTVHEFWSHDLNRRTLGFVMNGTPMPQGLFGPVRFDLPGGGRCEAVGKVMRCSVFSAGWYEGYILFIGAVCDDISRLTLPPLA